MKREVCFFVFKRPNKIVRPYMFGSGFEIPNQVIQFVPFSSPNRWRSPTTPWKGHFFTIPNRSLWITRNIILRYTFHLHKICFWGQVLRAGPSFDRALPLVALGGAEARLIAAEVLMSPLDIDVLLLEVLVEQSWVNVFVFVVNMKRFVFFCFFNFGKCFVGLSWFILWSW